MWIWGGINTHAFAEVDSQGKAWMLHVQTQLGAVYDTLLSWVSQALLAGHWVCVALRLQMQVFYVLARPVHVPTVCCSKHAWLTTL